MRKIAFIATSYIRQYDGVSVYIENLLIELIKQKELLIDIYVGRSVLSLLKQRLSDELSDNLENIEFIPVCDKSFFLKTIHLRYKIFKSHKYDLIFINNLMPFLSSKDKKLKVIHDFSISKFPNLYSKFRQLYEFFLIKSTILFDYGIGYISNSTKSDLKEFFNVDESDKTLLHLPNGIPFKVKKYTRPSHDRALLKYKQKDLRLCVVGRINTHKGFDRLLKFRNYYDSITRFDTVSLHIVGKQTSETKTILNSQHFKNIRLIFEGFLNDEELNKIYKNSHFSFFLSRNEGYGIPLIEAMWFKSIPIISNIPIFEEIMGKKFPKFDENSGYEEAIADFINSVFSDENYLKKIYLDIESVVKKEATGYEHSAKNLITFIKNLP